MTRSLAGRVLVQRASILPLTALVFIAAGVFATAWSDLPTARQTVWMVGLVLTGIPVVLRTLRGALHGRFAADIVATLAIVAAVLLQQPLVGLVIVLMQTGGEALERYAEGRASAAVRALEEAAPRIAHRLRADAVEDVGVEDVRVGDQLLVRPGELIPCDGVVVDGRSHVDTSPITGEPLPVTAAPGVHLMSGSLNQEGALTLRATAIARESQYARIVELVRSAQASKSPLQRLADRYAVWFTPLTLGVCVVTYALTGEPLRVLAVLAVATPCPLILATPVAILGGINRAARRQIILRHGTALEQIGATTVAIFDKTGTITLGLPRVRRVITPAAVDADKVLRLAAGVERASGHLLARTLVQHAADSGFDVPAVRSVSEAPGRGVVGEVAGHDVAVGARSYVLELHPAILRELEAIEPPNHGLFAYVAVDGRLGGIVEYADELRAEARDVLGALERLGIRRTILLSGDREANARAVAASVGIREVRGDLLPEDKVTAVRALVAGGDRVLMVGDGTNDAPALGVATVGVALAGHGGGITAEAADIVILTDDLRRVVEAIEISRRTMRIARQSIWVGLGMSGVAMLAAAAGFIAPAVGALIQEGIDLAVIVNALRASREPRARQAAATLRQPISDAVAVVRR